MQHTFVVDEIGGRPNCFIELGYALERRIRVIVTAEQDILLPFDQEAIPCHFWTHTIGDSKRRVALADFWRKNIEDRL